MNETYLMGSSQSIIDPPAIVVQAFDEQALKREWDEACEDEQSALERKRAVLQAALKQWPKVPRQGNRGQLMHSAGMRRFVREVLGMPDSRNGGINTEASRLLNNTVAEIRKSDVAYFNRTVGHARRLRRAVVELTDKYRLGADPKQCMDALIRMLDEQKVQPK